MRGVPVADLITAAAAAWTLAVVIALPAAGIEHLQGKHGRWTRLLRFAAGIPVSHGRDYWTNAGWLTRPGEVVLVKAGAVRKRASWWQHQNYAFRCCARSGWLAGPACWTALGVPGAVAAVAGVTVFAVYVRTVARPRWLSVSWVPRPRRHKDVRVNPIADALATVAPVSARAISRGISWNPDYANAKMGDLVASWDLPRGFKATPGEKATVEVVWTSRIGFDLDYTWATAAERPQLIMKRARRLPDIVYLHELLDRLDALPEYKTGIGLDDHDSVNGHDGLVCWDWSCENPHGAMNGGSRIGKTEVNKCMVAQILRKGGPAPDCPALVNGGWCAHPGCGGVTYIDPKEISIKGMERLPGLHLVNDPGDIPQMWEAIAEFRHVMDDRRLQRANGEAKWWPRRMLILEEVNQLSEQSDDLWADLDEENPITQRTEMWKPKHSKKTPRFWRHVKAIAWQGAAFNCHVFVDGQDLQATVLKGVRNSLGMRLLGGYLPQQWKFLVGTTPVPAAPAHRGRFCLAQGNEQIWLQAILGDKDPDLSSAIWRDYALNGRKDPGQLARNGIPPVTRNSGTNGQVSPGIMAAPSPVTDGATDALYLPMSLLDITRLFLLPGGDPEDQKKLKAMLHSDRDRSDRGDLPAGLVFPENKGLSGKQTELFYPAEVIDFNQRRRGTRRVTT